MERALACRRSGAARFSFCSFFVVPVGPCRTCTRTGPRSTVTAFLLTSLCSSQHPFLGSPQPLQVTPCFLLFLSFFRLLSSPTALHVALSLVPSSSFLRNHFSRRFYSTDRGVTSFSLHQLSLPVLLSPSLSLFLDVSLFFNKRFGQKSSEAYLLWNFPGETYTELVLLAITRSSKAVQRAVYPTTKLGLCNVHHGACIRALTIRQHFIFRHQADVCC